jgi:hypothetical protein
MAVKPDLMRLLIGEAAGNARVGGPLHHFKLFSKPGPLEPLAAYVIGVTARGVSYHRPIWRIVLKKVASVNHRT